MKNWGKKTRKITCDPLDFTTHSWVTSSSSPWKASSQQGRNTGELVGKIQSSCVLGAVCCLLLFRSYWRGAQSEVPQSLAEIERKKDTPLVAHSPSCPRVPERRLSQPKEAICFGISNLSSYREWHVSCNKRLDQLSPRGHGPEGKNRIKGCCFPTLFQEEWRWLPLGSTQRLISKKPKYPGLKVLSRWDLWLWSFALEANSLKAI